MTGLIPILFYGYPLEESSEIFFTGGDYMQYEWENGKCTLRSKKAKLAEAR